MLHVLTAQIAADERERAIQRRLREHEIRQEALAAAPVVTASVVRSHHPAPRPADRPCGGPEPASTVS